MDGLYKFTDDINRCSKCGLCQAVCPIYKETGNDCAVSRGKFVMLDGVINGDLKLNKNINKYLEMCLKCGKCSDFCPSGIDVCRIFRAAKHEYLNNSFEGKVVRFLQSENIFNRLLNVLDRNSTLSKKGRILYFRGCAEKIMHGNTYAVRKILDRVGLSTIEANFDCCGVPFLASGNLERYEKALQRNLKIINKFEGDFILTDCTSCEAALKEYPGINKNVVNTGDFIKNLNINFAFSNKKIITFHKPCHLRDDSFIKILLNKCKNVEYREMKAYDDCCGFAGQFAITNRKLSITLSKKKAQNALDTGADIILTTCPACILGLKQGLAAAKGIFSHKPQVMYVSEFLSKAELYLS